MCVILESLIETREYNVAQKIIVLIEEEQKMNPMLDLCSVGALCKRHFRIGEDIKKTSLNGME